MTVTTAHRERLASIRDRAKNAREDRQRAHQISNALAKPVLSIPVSSRSNG